MTTLSTHLFVNVLNYRHVICRMHAFAILHPYFLQSYCSTGACFGWSIGALGLGQSPSTQTGNEYINTNALGSRFNQLTFKLELCKIISQCFSLIEQV